MKKFILAAIAASLTTLACAAPLSYAPSSEVTLAINYLAREFDARINTAKGAHLDRPSGESYGEAQRAAGRAVFGAGAPFAVTRLPAKEGVAQYTLRIPGNRYDGDGAHSVWPDADLRIGISSDGSQVNGAGAWDGIDIRGKDYTTALHGIAIGLNQTRQPSGGWTGKLRFDVDSIVLAAIPDDNLPLRAEKSTLLHDVSRQGKAEEHLFDFHATRLTMGKAEIGDLHMAYRLRNIGTDLISVYARAANKPATDGLIKALLLRGASLDIEDISANFGGGRIQLTGSVGMPAATAADFSSEQRILNKVVAHFKVRLPLSSLRGIMHQFQKTAADGEASEMNPATVEQNVYELALGKLLANGYARMEKDALVTEIDIGDGLVRINGGAKTLSLQALLKEWNELDDTPPPKDDTPPAVVEWRDRSLESLLLFGGNKHPKGVEALCQHYSGGKAKNGEEAFRWCSLGAKMGRWNSQAALADLYRDGIGVQQDSQLERHWRNKASEADNDDDLNTAPTAASPTQSMVIKAGYFDQAYFRFDDTRTRSLELRLEAPQQHQKWGAMLSVCLSAEAPSDVACVTFSPEARDSVQLVAMPRTLSADSKSSDEGAYLDAARFGIGEKIHLQVYMRGQQAVFLINGEHKLVRDLLFQPQLLQMVCSTATCHMKFD